MLEAIESGPIATMCYLFSDEAKKAVLIDCPMNCFDIVSSILEKNGCELDKIFLTHSHWDHIADLHKFNVPIFVHELDKENVIHPGSDRVFCPFTIPPGKNIHTFTNNKIHIGNTLVSILHTPGHSPGSVCFYLERQQILFSGDTLFAQGIGRLDLPTGNESLMLQSLKQLSQLKKDLAVYPGHGPKETLGNMPIIQEINPL